MSVDSKVVRSARSDQVCELCLTKIPKGSSYVYAVGKHEGSLTSVKVCFECAYLLLTADHTNFKHANFTDVNIPNCIRKVRDVYRKDPGKAWKEFEHRKNNQEE